MQRTQLADDVRPPPIRYGARPAAGTIRSDLSSLNAATSAQGLAHLAVEKLVTFGVRWRLRAGQIKHESMT